jgi:hypothetical protein
MSTVEAKDNSTQGRDDAFARISVACGTVGDYAPLLRMLRLRIYFHFSN